MDRVEQLEKDVKLMQRRLETTLDIIMEHFRDNEERIDEMEDIMEELQNGDRESK